MECTKATEKTDCQGSCVGCVVANGETKGTCQSCTPVEYLENTYKQYIDTGIVSTNNTSIEMLISGISDASFALSSTGTWFYGARQAYLDKMFGSYYDPSRQKLNSAFSNAMNAVSYSKTNMYGDNKKFYQDKSGLYINGTKIISNTNNNAFSSPVSLVIFALNNNGSVLSFSAYKMHYCKIWDNGKLVRDFVPVLDWDDKPAMYDKISNTVFYNKGSGSFKTNLN